MLYEKILRSSSKIAELNSQLETFNKLLLFNNTQENVIYIMPQGSRLFVVTILQILRYDGKIKEFDLNGYLFDKRTGNNVMKKPAVNMYCRAVYNDKEAFLRNIHIEDFTVNEMWQNKGYGSIVMEQLIKYAKYLKVSYISGELSFVDIGTSDDDETKRENRERLFRFYPKFGFSIDKAEKTIRLDLTK